MKSLLQGFNSSFEQQKKDAVNLYIGKSKSPYVMNTKRKKKNKQSLWNKWNTTECTNICIMRKLKKRREIANNFSNLMRQESTRPTNWMNSKDNKCKTMHTETYQYQTLKAKSKREPWKEKQRSLLSDIREPQ